jgi:serine/threonine protein kinase
VHRDLKLENALFRDKITQEEDPEKNDLFVKVIDFGIAGVCETGKQDKDNAGSVSYMAPELFDGHAVSSSPALDTWSLGIIWYSLLYCIHPFYAEEEDDLIERIRSAKLKFDKSIPVSEECKSIISLML